MALSRREFLKDTGLIGAGLLLTPWDTIAAVLAAPQPPRKELLASLESIKEDTATKFINRTHPPIAARTVITGDWHWLTTDQQVEELRRIRPGLDKDNNGVLSYGVTLMDEGARPTYINLPEINRLVQGINGNSQSGDTILRQVIAHEMERKIQPRVDYQIPKRFRPAANEYTVYNIGATNGFNLITAREINSTDIANGTVTPNYSGGKTMSVLVNLDRMGAEAAAYLTLGNDYSTNYPVGRYWQNLHNFISIPEINLTPEDFLNFHRKSDPFGLGKVIAERAGYQSTAQYQQIRDEQAVSSGMLLAAFATEYGPSKEFDGLQAEMSLNLSYR